MSTQFPLPDAAKVRSMLGMLFDGMDVKPGPKVDASAAGSYVAVFIGDDGAPVAACACDLPFAAYSASALSMLPPPVAKDAVKSKALTEVMEGNLHEIMNICTRLVMNDTSPHLKLEKVYPAKSVPGPAQSLLTAPKGRIDFEITLAKYGPGVMTVLST